MARAFLNHRSLRFQLTALVDLLLIIVFAQFLELRQRQDDADRRQTVAVADLERDHKDKQETMRAANMVLRDAVNDANTELEQVKAALQVRDQQLQQSERAMRTAIEKLGSSSTTATPSSVNDRADIDMLQTRLNKLSTASREEINRFFIGYDELLKRAEVWLLHARETGEIVLMAGDETKTFRLESDRQNERATEFAERLFGAYKQIRQPKGLVIVLASYDLRATARVYQSMIDGLPRALDRMRADASLIRFEFSILGPTNDPVTSSP